MKKIKTKILFMLLIFILLLSIYLFRTPDTLSKYETSMTGSAIGGIAFYVIESGYQNKEINLDSIVPSETMYEYDFSVSNYNEEKRLETNAKYNIIIRTTTNLNLEYYLYENDNLTDILIDRQFIQDEDGTYFYIMKTNDEYFSYKENQSNNYTLKIKFPIEYISSEYQDIRESIEIIINSSQVVD